MTLEFEWILRQGSSGYAGANIPDASKECNHEVLPNSPGFHFSSLAKPREGGVQ